MTLTDKTLSESNSASDVSSLSKNIDRSKKSTKLKNSTNSPGSLSVKRLSLPPAANVTIESNHKDLKLFPIFNLSVCKNSAAKFKSSEISDPKELNRNYKRRKCSSDVNNAVNCLKTHSPEKELMRFTSKKQNSVAKFSTEICEDGNDLPELQDPVSHLANDVPVTNDKITLCDIETAVTETIEYLCSESQEAVSCGMHLPVNCTDDSSVKINSFNIDVTQGNLSESNYISDLSRVTKRKVGQPIKLLNLQNCMASEIQNEEQLFHPSHKDVKVENNNKELKIFPIFNLKVCKNADSNSDSINVPDRDKSTHTNKHLKCSPNVSERINSNFCSSQKEFENSSRKKTNTVKNLDINYDNSDKLSEFQESENDLTGMPVDKNEYIPVIEIDEAVAETVEYVCIQVAATNSKQLPVNYVDNTSMEINFVGLDTQRNSQNLTDSISTSEVTNLPKKIGRAKKFVKSKFLNSSEDCLDKSSVDIGASQANYKSSTNCKPKSDASNLPRKVGRPKKLVKSKYSNISEDCVDKSSVDFDSTLANYKSVNNCKDASNLSRKVCRPKKLVKSEYSNLSEDCVDKSSVDFDSTLPNCKSVNNCKDASNLSRKVGKKKLVKSEYSNLSEDCVDKSSVNFDSTLANCKSVNNCNPALNVLNLPRKVGRLKRLVKSKYLNSCEDCVDKFAVEDATQAHDNSFTICNPPLDALSLPRKRGRPQKAVKSNSSENSSDNHMFCFSSGNSKVEIKELEIFPIFNLPVCKNPESKLESENNADDGECTQNNKRQKCLFNSNNGESHLNIHLLKKESKKPSRRKRSTNANDSDIKSSEVVTAASESQELVNHVNVIGMPMTRNVDVPDVEDAIMKTVEYLNDKVQMTLTCSNSNFVDNSFVKNISVDKDATPNNNVPLLGIADEKQLKSNKKAKQKKTIHSKSPTSIMQKPEDSETSNRRQSLRSRGMRDNFINYSEDIHKPVEKGKAKTQLPSYQREKNRTVNEKPNCNADVINSLKTKTSKHQTKSENVKGNLKFFSIFTSPKLEPNSSLSKPGKRKAKAIDEVCTNEDVENDIGTKKGKLSSWKKKSKNQVNINCEKVLPLASQNLINNSKECSEIEIISDISDDSDVCVIQENEQQNSFCGKSSAKESTNKSIEVSAAKCIARISKKSVQSDQVTVACFPLFSHLQLCSTIFPDTSSNFKINEVSDYCIVSPTWTSFMGLVDFEGVQKINLNEQHDSERELLRSSTSNLSDVTADESNMLWTDCTLKLKMEEQNNLSTISEVKSWLLQWKNKFCSSSKKDSNSSDCYSSGSDSDDDFIYNGIIISGPTGSGKTSLVFSLANELGFTVLEVNASSSRNGRNISHQLKEALESYHVESIKVENSSIDSKFKENTVKKIENDNLQEKCKSKGIKSFFELVNKEAKEPNAVPENRKRGIVNFFQEKQNLKQKKKPGKLVEKTKKSNAAEAINLKNDKHSYKISGLTIVLFDDVDVIFEEDEGFWSTVKGFLKISKKPVIFTVGRNLSIVKAALNSGIQIFDLKPTTKEIALKKLKEHCKEHSREDTRIDLELLTSHNSSDLRRSILNAQFWTQTPPNIKEINSKASNPNFEAPVSKLVHVNSFLTADLNFSTNHIRKLLFDSLPHNFSNAILQYQSLGYDILHCNLFNILYNLRSTECEKWQTVTIESQNSGCSSSKNFSDSELWKEACELFERKKKALKSGSSSKELKITADALEEFSYADALRGICNTFQWISLTERVKMWTAGLPICSDQGLHMSNNILDIISLMHVYRLRIINKATLLNYSDTNADMHLNLEHSCFNFDQSFEYKTEKDLKCMSSSLPASQLLNRTALNLDYLSMIKIICQDEENRQLNGGKRSGRFLHYFDSISFYINYKNILFK